MLNEIDELIDLYPDLEELFEVLDITPSAVVEVLVRHGYVVLPDFLER